MKKKRKSKEKCSYTVFICMARVPGKKGTYSSTGAPVLPWWCFGFACSFGIELAAVVFCALGVGIGNWDILCLQCGTYHIHAVKFHPELSFSTAFTNIYSSFAFDVAFVARLFVRLPPRIESCGQVNSCQSGRIKLLWHPPFRTCTSWRLLWEWYVLLYCCIAVLL